jgi:hypothetical protein
MFGCNQQAYSISDETRRYEQTYVNLLKVVIR